MFLQNLKMMKSALNFVCKQNFGLLSDLPKPMIWFQFGLVQLAKMLKFTFFVESRQNIAFDHRIFDVKQIW